MRMRGLEPPRGSQAAGGMSGEVAEGGFVEPNDDVAPLAPTARFRTFAPGAHPPRKPWVVLQQRAFATEALAGRQTVPCSTAAEATCTALLAAPCLVED